MSGFVLCRRDVSSIGEAARFCAKPIAKPNPRNLCAGCSERLPVWPVNEDGTPCSPSWAESAQTAVL